MEHQRSGRHRRALHRGRGVLHGTVSRPWRGREQVVEGWLERKDKPGEATFDWQPIAITDEVAIIQGTTTYPAETYSNLWVIKLDGDGRCRQFTEWWMQHPPAPS